MSAASRAAQWWDANDHADMVKKEITAALLRLRFACRAPIHADGMPAQKPQWKVKQWLRAFTEPDVNRRVPMTSSAPPLCAAIDDSPFVKMPDPTLIFRLCMPHGFAGTAGEICDGRAFMRKCVCGLVKCKRGVTSIEYALIASLIAMVIISAVTLVGTSVSAAFQSVAGGF